MLFRSTFTPKVAVVWAGTVLPVGWVVMDGGRPDCPFADPASIIESAATTDAASFIERRAQFIMGLVADSWCVECHAGVHSESSPDRLSARAGGHCSVEKEPASLRELGSRPGRRGKTWNGEQSVPAHLKPIFQLPLSIPSQIGRASCRERV